MTGVQTCALPIWQPRVERVGNLRFHGLGATAGDVAQMSVGVDPGCLSPSVAVERRLSGVARLTQAAEVTHVVGAAVLQRDDVVDFLRRGVPAGREAVLTQVVGGDVGGADLAPADTVAPVDLRVTLPLAVAFVFGLGVGFAEEIGRASCRERV